MSQNGGLGQIDEHALAAALIALRDSSREQHDSLSESVQSLHSRLDGLDESHRRHAQFTHNALATLTDGQAELRATVVAGFAALQRVSTDAREELDTLVDEKEVLRVENEKRKAENAQLAKRAAWNTTAFVIAGLILQGILKALGHLW